jgi:hypothetical protein
VVDQRQRCRFRRAHNTPAVKRQRSPAHVGHRASKPANRNGGNQRHIASLANRGRSMRDHQTAVEQAPEGTGQATLRRGSGAYPRPIQETKPEAERVFPSHQDVGRFGGATGNAAAVGLASMFLPPGYQRDCACAYSLTRARPGSYRDRIKPSVCATPAPAVSDTPRPQWGARCAPPPASPAVSDTARATKGRGRVHRQLGGRGPAPARGPRVLPRNLHLPGRRPDPAKRPPRAARTSNETQHGVVR